ncbi:hypothetical protein LJC54_00155 [Parabacteroides sp. OttesenSCG-928-J18]|nr:hypothetical protein [Parabacteroides sp. OttesenSCG-928-J18]
MVIEGGFDPIYFLDKMSFYELNNLIENIHYKNREQWEQTRLLAYISASPYSKKSLKINDIMEFDWDNKKEEKQEPKEITDADIERLRREAKQMEDRINKIKIN